VVTVGAEDELGTSNPADDTMVSWSSYGTTQDGFAKPEVVAPGRHIVSVLAGSNVLLALQFPDRLLGNSQYIWLSGTSMSAAVVSGAAALVFQAHPDWTNDQLKGALMQAAKPVSGAGQGAGRIDVPSTIAVSGSALANQGIPISGQLIGPNGATLYSTASWSTSSWSSSSWSSSSWSSSSWSSSSWSSSSDATSSGG